MRVARWALVVLGLAIVILLTIVFIGFIYGLVQLGIAAVRAARSRLSQRGVSTPPGGTSCTK